MDQESVKIAKLNNIIKYLNYNGPLFIRSSSEFESINQKRAPRIGATV